MKWGLERLLVSAELDSRYSLHHLLLQTFTATVLDIHMPSLLPAALEQDTANNEIQRKT